MPELLKAAGVVPPEEAGDFWNAFKGVNRRQSLSIRDLWRHFESLEIKPNNPNQNSNAITSINELIIHLIIQSIVYYHFDY